MGLNPPREFGRSEDIVCTFFYQMDLSDNGEDVVEDIVQIATVVDLIMRHLNYASKLYS